MTPSYNAVVFSSSSTNDYDIHTVNNGFTLPSANVSANDQETINLINGYKGLTRLRQEAVNGTLQRLNVTECIKAYAQDLVTSRSGLLLVVSNGSSTTQATVFHSTRSGNENAACNTPNERYPWICSQDGFVNLHDGVYGSHCGAPGYTTCQYRLEGIISNTTGWRPFEDLRVDYCLSEQVAPHCKLQTSFELLIIVLVINFVKMAGIWWTYYSRKVRYDRLRTIGDAIASFLDEHDPHTKGMSLLSAADVYKGKLLGYETVFKPFINKRPRLFSAVNRNRWIACIAVYATGLAVMIGLLIHGLRYVSSLPYVQGSAFNTGLDSLDPRFFITWSVPTSGTEGLLSNVLVANIPQAIVSMMYFTYNDLGTRMAAAWEWSTYAIARKSLRVSTKPQGQQRSSYFLTLPYRFAMPLMVGCGLLHWLVSQSIYPVVTEHYTFMKYGNQSYEWDSPQYYPQPGEMTCAWSPVGVLATIAVGTLLVAAILFVSSFRLASPMPVVGSNSLAIAAACQVEQKTSHRLSRRRVQWGVIRSEMDNSAHCGFSDSIEGMPVPGMEYT